MNERIRREILNRRESNEQNARAFRICDRYGLRYDIDHMFGLPEESEADHVRAARFYRGLRKLNRLKCHNLTCFPRTRIAEIAHSKGLLDDGEVRQMEEGRTGDFFHVDEMRNAEAQRLKAGFVVLYKILPLLCPPLLEKVLRRRGYRWFQRIPAPLVVLAQAAIALRSRDYRFFLYFRYYLLRIRRSLLAPLRFRRLVRS
jgi:radical SAM superfamily enzyme YgiQ (UPF0313 family)